MKKFTQIVIFYFPIFLFLCIIIHLTIKYNIWFTRLLDPSGEGEGRAASPSPPPQEVLLWRILENVKTPELNGSAPNLRKLPTALILDLKAHRSYHSGWKNYYLIFYAPSYLWCCSEIQCFNTRLTFQRGAQSCRLLCTTQKAWVTNPTSELWLQRVEMQLHFSWNRDTLVVKYFQKYAQKSYFGFNSCVTW